MPLEAPHPGFGPPIFLTKSVGKVYLGRLEITQCPVSLSVELVYCELHGVRPPPKYGRVTDVRAPFEHKMTLHPIMDDATFARHVVEETVYVSRNHDIQVHEQTVAADIELIVHEET